MIPIIIAYSGVGSDGITDRVTKTNIHGTTHGAWSQERSARPARDINVRDSGRGERVNAVETRYGSVNRKAVDKNGCMICAQAIDLNLLETA